MGDRKSAYKVLVGRLEEKRPLGRTRFGWEDNIKVNLQAVGWEKRNELIWLRIGTVGGCL
jgi:hypothetical protein